jgi:hypothetical protein
VVKNVRRVYTAVSKGGGTVGYRLFGGGDV